MLTWIIILIIVAILAVLGLAASKPGDFRITREAAINAPPAKVFALINDFHEWSKWSPWEKMDPAMQRTHSGAQSGKGAAYAWSGNKKVGRGRMEIIESTPPSRLGMDIEFMEPFQAKNKVEFTLTPAGGGTKLSWTMSGIRPFMLKLMGLFMNFDQMVGKDFEAGLRAIKEEAEKS